MWSSISPRKTVLVSFIGIGVVAAVLVMLRDAELTPLRVALNWLNQAQFAGIYVADAEGFYASEGITVSTIERDLKSPDIADLLIEGRADIAIMSSTDFLRAANKGRDVVALAAVLQVSPTAVVALANSGIQSPNDLAGRKVGMAFLSEEAKLPIYALLETSNIPKSLVSFSDVGYNQADALLRGDVDAVAVYRTNELYELDKKEVAYTVIAPERFGVDMYGDIIVVRKQYLLDHEKEIGAFLRATFRGWEFAEENLDRAVRVTLAVDNPRYHDATRERYILENTLKLVRQYPKQNMGQMIPMHWTYTHNLLRRHGLVGDIELSNFFVDAAAYRRMGFPEYW